MENVPIPLALMQDPPALNQPEMAHVVGRDPVRTPMQWDDSPNAGFTHPDATPWLPLAADYETRNVARQDAEPASMLNLYRALTALRCQEPALYRGAYQAVEAGVDDVLAYLRTADGHARFLVVLNLGSSQHTLDLSAAGSTAQIAIASDLLRAGNVDLAHLALGPDEGLVLRLD